MRKDRRTGNNKRNRKIVLDFLIHSDSFYFKCKILSKKIEGLTNDFELTIGTDPNLPDTDFDGYTDYEEYIAGTNPLDATDTPSTEPTFFGLAWYGWIIIAIIIIIIVGLVIVINGRMNG